jgi:hypothetical protein
MTDVFTTSVEPEILSIIVGVPGPPGIQGVAGDSNTITSANGSITAITTGGNTDLALNLGHENVWSISQSFALVIASTLDCEDAVIDHLEIPQVGLETGWVLTASDMSGDAIWAPPGATGVSSVSNSDGSLTISPNAGAVIASVNLGHANAWTGSASFAGTLTALGNMFIQGATCGINPSQTGVSTGVGGWSPFSATGTLVFTTPSASTATTADMHFLALGQSSITGGASGHTITIPHAASLYIAHQPQGDSHTTITNPYSMWVAAGNVRLDGGLQLTSGGALNYVLTSDASGNATWTAPSASGVTSVATDATLTGGTITSTGTLGLNLANSNSWSATQTFSAITTTSITSASTLALSSGTGSLTIGSGLTGSAGLIVGNVDGNYGAIWSAGLTPSTLNFGIQMKATSTVVSSPGSLILKSNALAQNTWILASTGIVQIVAQQITINAIGSASTLGCYLLNGTAAATGAQQFSPAIQLSGQGWKTTATAASQQCDWQIQNQPVQGTTAPTSNLVFSSQVALGGFVTALTLSNAGIITNATWNGTTIAIANGGTGQTTASTAINALVPSQTGNSGDVLSTNGTAVSWTAPTASINGWEAPFTKPTIAGVTQVNTSAYTITDDTNGLFVRRTGTVSASDNLGLFHVAVPGSGGWSCTIRIQPIWSDESYGLGGVHLYESTTGKVMAFGNQGVSGISYLRLSYFSSPTAFASNPQNIPSQHFTWLRWTYDGSSHYSTWYSFDGYSWMEYSSNTQTTYFTTAATHAGFFLDANDASLNAGIKCMSMVVG